MSTRLRLVICLAFTHWPTLLSGCAASGYSTRIAVEAPPSDVQAATVTLEARAEWKL